MKFITIILGILVLTVSALGQQLTDDDFIPVAVSPDHAYVYVIIKPSIQATPTATSFAYVKLHDKDNFIITFTEASCSKGTLVELYKTGYVNGKEVDEKNPNPTPIKPVAKSIGTLLLNIVCKNNEFFE